MPHLFESFLAELRAFFRDLFKTKVVKIARIRLRGAVLLFKYEQDPDGQLHLFFGLQTRASVYQEVDFRAATELRDFMRAFLNGHFSAKRPHGPISDIAKIFVGLDYVKLRRDVSEGGDTRLFIEVFVMGYNEVTPTAAAMIAAELEGFLSLNRSR
jgi:hypothetical protein